MAVDTSATTTGTPAGHVPGHLRAIWLFVESMWVWYRRNWRSSAFSSMLLPLLYLVAMGLGLGTFVDAGGRAAGAIGGVGYLQYIAPAVMVATAIQNATGEVTYPVLSGFRWQKNYWAVASTPVSPAQVADGHLLWVTLRIGLSALVYLVIAALLGAVASPGAILALPVAVLTGMAFGAPLAAYSATLDTEGQQFSVVFRFIVMPMMLFAGTFFPIEQLPAWVRPLAWITPLWHGNELARGVTLGGLDPLPALGHVAYLLALLVAGVLLTRRMFDRRLAS
ncbi:transport permease protein [Longimycelium tulufanense]|uniref:Transport permease protein n=1 Tax=Longimycelium tulufanense TaxID=907463 RepID=A0A8J3C8A5_9PSEU|nr:ABC transporter permease [Longimycelium tulufanense]GGM53531.1 transport permease protein [Longimycelium tulufanense]